jgi:PAS domain S-box-containing protein
MARVIVVDDNPVNRDLVVTLLGYGGHLTTEAVDGAHALANARSDPPDLVITDLLMPVMDGYELVREIRADPALAATPVIFYTANYLQEEARPIAEALGVRHIVSKPIDPRHLLMAVDQALADGVAECTVPPDTFHREHQRALSAKLLDKVRDLEHADEALRKSEARFRSLAEFAPVGIFSRAAGQVSYANSRLREICGIPDAADVSVNWAALVHPDDRDRWLNDVARAVEDQGGLSDRIRVIRPDGEQRWIRVRLARVQGSDEEATYVGAVEDITEVIESQREREEMERRLRVSERLESLGQLAAGVAHDFNNLLAVILNYAEFVDEGLTDLAGDSPDPRWTQMHEDALAVRDAADRAAALTRRLLVFGNRDVAHLGVVDVNAVVRATLTLLDRTIGEHVELHHELDEELAPLTSDGVQFEQVLVNLVVNARDAVGAGGRVVVRTTTVHVNAENMASHGGSKPGRYARITVADDGQGMAPETIARAFEPFFTTKAPGQGTGLGLSTVYGTVTRLGGSVTIESVQGRGTSVSVYLPADDGVAAVEVDRGAVAVDLDALPAADGLSASAAAVVLVAEDDDWLRSITSRILTENGATVVAVNRGAAAAELLMDESKAFDLLLTDVVMPQMSGRELAEHAAKVRPAMPVLFMSGYADGLLGAGHREPLKDALLEKPFTPASLLDAVARALARTAPGVPITR